MLGLIIKNMFVLGRLAVFALVATGLLTCELASALLSFDTASVATLHRHGGELVSSARVSS